MPLFLLRDGSIRRFTVVPEGLQTSIYQDRHGRSVHVVLEARGEKELLAAWEGRRQGAAGAGRRSGIGRGQGRGAEGTEGSSGDPGRLAA
jgi:hypothetical protein